MNLKICIWEETKKGREFLIKFSWMFRSIGSLTPNRLASVRVEILRQLTTRLILCRPPRLLLQISSYGISSRDRFDPKITFIANR